MIKTRKILLAALSLCEVRGAFKILPKVKTGTGMHDNERIPDDKPRSIIRIMPSEAGTAGVMLAVMDEGDPARALVYDEEYEYSQEFASFPTDDRTDITKDVLLGPKEQNLFYSEFFSFTLTKLGDKFIFNNLTIDKGVIKEKGKTLQEVLQALFRFYYALNGEFEGLKQQLADIEIMGIEDISKSVILANPTLYLSQTTSEQDGKSLSFPKSEKLPWNNTTRKALRKKGSFNPVWSVKSGKQTKYGITFKISKEGEISITEGKVNLNDPVKQARNIREYFALLLARFQPGIVEDQAKLEKFNDSIPITKALAYIYKIDPADINAVKGWIEGLENPSNKVFSDTKGNFVCIYEENGLIFKEYECTELYPTKIFTDEELETELPAFFNAFGAEYAKNVKFTPKRINNLDIGGARKVIGDLLKILLGGRFQEDELEELSEKCAKALMNGYNGNTEAN